MRSASLVGLLFFTTACTRGLPAHETPGHHLAPVDAAQLATSPDAVREPSYARACDAAIVADELVVTCSQCCPPDKDRIIFTYCQGETVMQCDGSCYEAVKRCRSKAACITWDPKRQVKAPDGRMVPDWGSDAKCAETKADCPALAMAYELEVHRLQLTVVSSGSLPLAPGPTRAAAE